MSDKAASPAPAAAPEVKESAAAAEVDTAAASASTPATKGDEAAVATSDADASLPLQDGTSANINATDNATPATNGVVAGTKKKEKRKSTASVPEHKNKKLNRKKSTPNLNLDVQPGQYWFVQMKGYPTWPGIICDEEMLPESLLSKRPVSALRTDGTYRQDFRDGGKNVRDRRYPVMFLGTNEFAWHINSDFQPLDMDEVKSIVEKGEQGKKTKALWGAYEAAAAGHDLTHFKKVLRDFEEGEVLRAQQKEAADEAREAKAEEDTAKKAKRQSAVGASTDVEMEDASDGAAKKPKKSNKRKASKDVEGEGETEEKPTKTLKKIKIKAPAIPTEEATPKVKKSKARKPKAESAAVSTPTPRVEETLTPAQLLEKKQKTILYLRHKLQKGFLSRDAAPKEDEMPQMSEHLTQLEAHTNLEATIIRGTKINKVLKGIVRLAAIPQEEKFTFKKRSEDLLAQWNKSLASDEASPAAAAVAEPAPPATNGVNHDDKPAEEESKTVESAEAPAPAESKEAVAQDARDVTMTDDPAPAEAIAAES